MGTVKIKYWPTLIDFGKELDGFYNRTNLKKRGHKHTSALATTGDCEDTNIPVKYPVQNFGLLLLRSMLCIDFPLVLVGISCFAALLSIAFNQFSARLPPSPARGEQ